MIGSERCIYYLNVRYCLSLRFKGATQNYNKLNSTRSKIYGSTEFCIGSIRIFIVIDVRFYSLQIKPVSMSIMHVINYIYFATICTIKHIIYDQTIMRDTLSRRGQTCIKLYYTIIWLTIYVQTIVVLKYLREHAVQIKNYNKVCRKCIST